MRDETSRDHAMLVMGLALHRKTGPGVRWARRIVTDSKSRCVPPMKLAMAEAAIREWEITHPPRRREPGDDDEPIDSEAIHDPV